MTETEAGVENKTTDNQLTTGDDISFFTRSTTPDIPTVTINFYALSSPASTPRQNGRRHCDDSFCLRTP